MADLTPEHLSRFNTNINQAKNMQDRQKEIVRDVLEREIEIGKQRIAYLNEYFDIYFKKLDQVARKCDEMPEVFQMLANSAASGKPLSIEYKSTDKSPADDSSSKDSKKSKNKSSIQNRDLSDKGNEIDLTTDFTSPDAKLARKQIEIDNNKAVGAETRLAELKHANAKKLHAIEKEYLAERTKLAAEIEYGKTFDAAKDMAAIDKAKEEDAIIKAMAAKRNDFIAKAELAAKRKNNGILTEEAAANILKEADLKYSLEEKNLEELRAEHRKKLVEEARATEREQTNQNLNIIKTGSYEDRKEAFKNLTSDENGDFSKGKALSALVTALGNLAKQLETKVDEIGKAQGEIDTRLQGSSNKTYAGSYWGQLTKDMMSVGAVTPYYRLEDFTANIKSLVDTGIAFDLKQRAFLMTIHDKIATTFDAADGTLLRLIRIQQEDSTAGRLGMESALNSFLNSMYENTEYLKGVAGSVRTSLEEMEALMSGAGGTEVEFQVQKWLGSLYSVGMSQAAVSSIATAFGQIASGQIEGLTSGGAGNLIIMAANDANIPIADMLIRGLDASNTNTLLQATVNYLAEIAESTTDNQVVQQQLAKVFGVSASDLRAATNLASAGSVSNIAGYTLGYDSMITQLVAMASSMGKRTSMGEKMSNIWDNAMYSLAASMSNNPVSYFIYKMASLLESATGGIALPFVNIMGHGVDLNTTVSDLMRVGAMGTGILGSLGSMVGGLGRSFSGRAMLSQMGIESSTGLAVTPRGSISPSMLNSFDGGGDTSGSGYIGNAAASDIKNTTLQSAEDEKQSLMVEAQEEASKTPVDEINTNVLKIYKLLEDVVSGKSNLRVRVDSYGLVNGGDHGGRTSFLAGPAGLASQSASLAANSGYIGSSSAASVAAGSGSLNFGGSVDIGNWVLA